MRIRKQFAFFITVLISATLAFWLWWVCANKTGEFHEVQYLLWRNGVFRFDPTVVYYGMIGDKNREDLVVGLSVSELESKFKLLRPVDDATSEQEYYSKQLEGQDVRWLGDSHWLVIFKNGRATELRLMKG